MKKIMMMAAGLGSVAMLAGCGSGSPATATTTPAAPSSTTTAEPSPTTSEATLTAGDVAACKGYLRIEPKANQDLKELGDSKPVFIIDLVFKTMAEDVEANTVAATSDELKTAFEQAHAAIESARQTTKAYKDGTLDLTPDLRALYEATQTAADLCASADPAGDYKPIANLS